ncbi:MAG: hypothetical protein HYV29_12530 [Ignavibacteriales bacterium]|nr:hypothetical protein [Ignavibacteriales bacterium]
MKLGTLAFITLYTLHYDAAKKFFNTLGFSTISFDASSALMTDGNLYFDIRQSEQPATVLSYIAGDIGNRIEMAVNLELKITEQSQHHAVISDPNGLNILLIDSKMMPLKEFVPGPISMCGTFYEISLETDDIERSITWWYNVGFKVTAQKDTWCTLDDGKIKIGLYKRGTCPHKFKNPSLTYFESDMKRRIEEITKRGVTFVQDEQEIGMEGHAIVESPDGQYFFLFTA